MIDIKKPSVIILGWIKKIVAIFAFLVLIVLFKTFLNSASVTIQKDTDLPIYKENYTNKNDEISNMFRDIADSGKCSYSTLNSVNSDSIDMTYYFPCSWKEYKENNDIPTLIKQYTVNLSDSCLVGLSVDISTSPVDLTATVIKKIRNKEVLKDLTKASGDFISFQLIDLGKIPGDEVITVQHKNNPQGSTYSLLNHFYYHNRIITFTYLVVSKNNLHASGIFNTYKDVFRNLIKMTKISKL